MYGLPFHSSAPASGSRRSVMTGQTLAISAFKAMNRIWRLVSFGSSSTRPDCYNKRDEMWQNAKEWLKEGGSIPDDQVLYDDLVGPETVPRMDGKIKLEGKEDMRTKGLPSPNRADALALSFAFPVRKKDDRLKMNQQLYKANTNYSLRR